MSEGAGFECHLNCDKIKVGKDFCREPLHVVKAGASHRRPAAEMLIKSPGMADVSHLANSQRFCPLPHHHLLLCARDGSIKCTIEHQHGHQAEPFRGLRLVHHAFLGRGRSYAALRDVARRGRSVRARGCRLLAKVTADFRRGADGRVKLCRGLVRDLQRARDQELKSKRSTTVDKLIENERR